MQLITDLLRFFFGNLDIILGAVLPIIAVLKLTSWGRANAEALRAAALVIEELGAKEVKEAIASKESGLTDVAKDVLQDAVSTVDPKKTPRGSFELMVRELWRGIFPVK